MDIAPSDIGRMPVENVHVARVAFGAVWAAAEREEARLAAGGVSDWYVGGVVATCRWLAVAVVRHGERRWPARAPVTRHTRMATPELIEAECLAAERLDMRRPVPEWLAERPGWSAGIVATLAWAWRGTAGPPIVVGACAQAADTRGAEDGRI